MATVVTVDELVESVWFVDSDVSALADRLPEPALGAIFAFIVVVVTDELGSMRSFLADSVDVLEAVFGSS